MSVLDDTLDTFEELGGLYNEGAEQKQEMVLSRAGFNISEEHRDVISQVTRLTGWENDSVTARKLIYLGASNVLQSEISKLKQEQEQEEN